MKIKWIALALFFVCAALGISPALAGMEKPSLWLAQAQAHCCSQLIAQAITATPPIEASAVPGGYVLSCPGCQTPAPTFQSAAVAAGATHYWPLNETSGSTMLDAVGTLNGTYTGVFPDTLYGCVPMGMKDGSCGINMYNGYGTVTALPTSAPYSVGVIVRACDNQASGTHAVSLFGSFGQSSDQYHGGGFSVYGNGSSASPLELFASYGSGSSSLVNDTMIPSFSLSCHSFLLVEEYQVSNGITFFINGIGLVGPTNSTLPVSASLAINTSYTGGGFNQVGQGEVYCCMFYIPAYITGTQLESLLSAAGI